MRDGWVRRAARASTTIEMSDFMVDGLEEDLFVSTYINGVALRLMFPLAHIYLVSRQSEPDTSKADTSGFISCTY